MPGWGWVLASGVVDLLLGLLILGGWPGSGLWVLGLFISIDLPVVGMAYIVLVLQLRCGGTLAVGRKSGHDAPPKGAATAYPRSR